MARSMAMAKEIVVTTIYVSIGGFDTRSNQFLAECLSWCLLNNMSVNGGRQIVLYYYKSRASLGDLIHVVSSDVLEKWIFYYC